MVTKMKVTRSGTSKLLVLCSSLPNRIVHQKYQGEEEEWDFEADDTLFVVTKADTEEVIDFDEEIEKRSNEDTEDVIASEFHETAFIIEHELSDEEHKHV